MATGGEARRSSASRRSFVRFPALCRVEYEHRDHRVVGFTSEVSSGGLFVQGATFLEIGDTLDVELFLVPGEPPLHLSCLVRHVSKSGAGMEIMRGQGDKGDAIRAYIDERLAARLRDRVDVVKAPVGDIVRLAAYYCEARRYDDALELYRKALAARSDEGSLYEGLALLLVQRIREVSTDAAPLMDELDEVLDRGLKRGSSSGLVAAQRELGALRQGTSGGTTTRMDLATADALMRGAEAQELDARERKLKQLARALDERQAELEAEKQRLAAEHQEIEEERNSLEAERTDIGQQKLSLDKVRAKLERANSDLVAKQDRVAGELAALDREQGRASPFGPPTVIDDPGFAETTVQVDATAAKEDPGEGDWGVPTTFDARNGRVPPLQRPAQPAPRSETGDWNGITGKLVHAARHKVAPRVTQAFSDARSYARAHPSVLIAAGAIGAAVTALIAFTIIAFSPETAVVMSTVTVEGSSPVATPDAETAAAPIVEPEPVVRRPHSRPKAKRKRRKDKPEVRAKAPAPEANAPRVKLGVKVRQVDAATAEAAGMMGATGAFVLAVTAGEAGAKAGIRPGDIILSFDGRTVKNAKALAPTVARAKAGRPAKVVVWRNERAVILSVKF